MCGWCIHCKVRMRSRTAIETLVWLMEDAFEGDPAHSLLANLRQVKKEDWTAMLSWITSASPTGATTCLHAKSFVSLSRMSSTTLARSTISVHYYKDQNAGHTNRSLRNSPA